MLDNLLCSKYFVQDCSLSFKYDLCNGRIQAMWRNYMLIKLILLDFFKKVTNSFPHLQLKLIENISAFYCMPRRVLYKIGRTCIFHERYTIVKDDDWLHLIGPHLDLFAYVTIVNYTSTFWWCRQNWQLILPKMLISF